MASSYSTDLKLELMVTGENAGTWGDKTNTNLNLLQQAIAGYQEVSIAGGAQTTTLVMSNATISNARNAVIKLTGTITGNQIVTVPTGIEKTYIVSNGTVGAFTVQFIQAGGTGVTFATTDKSTKILFADGTNIVDTGTVSETGIQTLTNKTLTSPIINEIDDANSNEQIKFTATASAVNEFTVTNAATGNAPEISATGGDTNIDLKITPKGSGKVVLDGIKYPNADGSANQVLKTDGSGNLSFATPSAGFSGATINNNSAVDRTLTSASTQVQNIAMTVADKSVILPDATTLTTEGSQVYVITNAGPYTFYIKNSDGYVITNVTINQSKQLALIDNSTSGGKWSETTTNIPLACSSVVTSTGAGGSTWLYYPLINGVSISKISSTSALATYHKGTSNRDVYGVVVSYSGSTITVNSETLLYNGSSTTAQNSQACMLDSTTGLLFVNRSSNNVAVPFTISGTTITAGTTSSTFGVGPTAELYSQIGRVIAMTSTEALIAERNSTTTATWTFRTVTHNGASAPTIGTASSAVTNDWTYSSPDMVAIDSTNAFVLYQTVTTGYTVARVVTISGASAPTLQTANTTSTTNLGVNGQGYFPVKISSTEFIAVGGNASINYTVSGTTVTYVGVLSYENKPGVISLPFQAGDVLLGLIAENNNWWMYSKFGSYYLPRTFYFANYFPFLPYSQPTTFPAAYVGLDNNTWFAVRATSSTVVMQFAILKYIGS